ncbi:L-histidine N(alpha)-methyltransferase [Pedobacter sp. BMA]|uniref:L-histidine N(alpha)-methyltransferase n=1 Tax=Pedobacter sp. BMA TaxID=1663685 RepID=UPI000649E3AF|nr:L-histidine N(alpha)-methyltransferase [Pedobacter sp. BMA]KLT65473.1 methyltransferase [Pedobacter sp. BMA]
MILTTETNTEVNNQFLNETITGLSAKPKYMHSKYFYDEAGDYIFQQIMNMEEYYLTDAEMEIMQYQADQIANVISDGSDAFDLIELGAGDATKSIHLLRKLINKKLNFQYFPIDISAHVISDLSVKLPQALPELQFTGLNGDYFDMLKAANETSDRQKVVLFMGANIGNMNVDEAEAFCVKVKALLSPDDLLIIGFDLKKNPKQILDAYNDKSGITRSFNLNLLNRINRELEGNFNLDHFEHYATYDPETGECKSYLISLENQVVNIGEHAIQFQKNEYVYMEISQKYAIAEIERLAHRSGFKVQQYFFDSRQYFVDAIWKVA